MRAAQAQHQPKLPVRGTLRRVGAAYRRQWRLLVPVAVMVFVPLSATEMVEGEAGTFDGDEGALLLVAFLLLVAVMVIASTLGAQFYSGVVGAAAAELRTGHRASVSEVLRSLPYLRLIAIDLIVTVAVAGGFLLLVVPGVIAFARLWLAAPLATIEDLGVRASLRRSRELVRGSAWRVLAILLPIILATEAASELVQWIVGEVVRHGRLGEWAGAAVAGTLLSPVVALATVLVAYELIDLRGVKRLDESPGAHAPGGHARRDPPRA